MGKKLYVGNLSYSVNDEMLAEAFSQCGVVDSAKVIIDRDTQRSKGFGFIEMSTEEEAQEAINTLNSTELSGRTITVNEAKPMAPRQNNRGSFGGGGGGRNNRW